MSIRGTATRATGAARATGATRGAGAARVRGLGAACLALALGGCALLMPASPPATFDLRPAAGAVARRPRAAGAVIVVAEPTTLSALNSERIVARPSPVQITYFGGVQWSDRLPTLVQTRVIHAFEDAAWLRSVGRPSDALTADYRLMSDIRAFGVDVGAAPPTASVEMAVKLVNDRTGRIVAARVFRAAAPAASTEPAAGVAALDVALGQVLSEIVAWASREHLTAASGVTETGRGEESSLK